MNVPERAAADASEPFVDPALREGQQRIRSYVIGWLERLDYRGRLDRAWSADELGARIWDRIRQDYAVHLTGPVTDNDPLARVVATAAVEDFFAAYPERRTFRYAVGGPLGDEPFRRAVLDFVHDLEDFEPHALPPTPSAAAELFWQDVEEAPRRWGRDPEGGPLVDDEAAARRVVVEAISEYYDLLHEAATRRP